MSKACSKCGTENADDAKFCRSCGAGLSSTAPAPDETVAMRACRACGQLNRTSARFCEKCGVDILQPAPAVAAPLTADDSTVPAASLPPLPPSPTPASIATPAPTHATWPAAETQGARRKPLGLWIAAGALVAVLGAAGVLWLGSSRSPPAPTFDSAPPPSVLGERPAPASMPSASASAPAAAPASAPVDAPITLPPPVPATTPAPAASEPPAAVPELLRPSAKPEPAASERPQPAKARPDDKAARDAKAKALREQRAQAEAALARRRAEEARARAAQAAPAAAPPAPRAAPAPAPAPTPPAPQPRTVQERCAGGNPLSRGICESRECARAEHANEPVCQRIKAADDRRREQN